MANLGALVTSDPEERVNMARTPEEQRYARHYRKALSEGRPSTYRHGLSKSRALKIRREVETSLHKAWLRPHPSKNWSIF